MSTVQEIESAIAKLSEEEVNEIRARLFDRDIARNAENGVLDVLADEVIRDARAGRVKPLDTPRVGSLLGVIQQASA